ncbi:MAG: ATP-binding protein, partial [Pseudonocardiaceae bacterium]
HRVFFGRTGETRELVELLRSPAEHAKGAAMLVVGPSGCGKSSLVRAALAPVLAGEPDWWTLPPIVPGADPVAALVRELATAARQLGLAWTVAHVRDQLANGWLARLADELLLSAPDASRKVSSFGRPVPRSQGFSSRSLTLCSSSSSCPASIPDIRSNRNGFSVVKGLVSSPPFYRLEKPLPVISCRVSPGSEQTSG